MKGFFRYAIFDEAHMFKGETSASGVASGKIKVLRSVCL